MKRRLLLMVVIIVALMPAVLATAAGDDFNELVSVRKATAQFRSSEAAQAAGWDLVPGLDYCFENPGVGAMGYHYINTSLLDLRLDPLQPEAMVYDPRPDGLRLGAVEWIVPAAAWDGAGNTQPPVLFDRSLHFNEKLGVYVLHAWIWEANPDGVWEDWNPRVSCTYRRSNTAAPYTAVGNHYGSATSQAAPAGMQDWEQIRRSEKHVPGGGW